MRDIISSKVNNFYSIGDIMNNLTLGQKLKKLRLEKGLTQQDVTGDFITRNMLSKIENDLANPSFKTIEYLAKQLDTPISYFLESMVEGFSVPNPSETESTDNLELLFEHSCLLIRNEEYEKCIKYLEEILVEFQSSSNSSFYAKLIYNIAVCFYRIKKYDVAKERFESAYNNLLQAKDYYLLSYTCFYLYYIYYLDNDLIKSEELLQRSITLLHKSYIHDYLYEIKLYYTLGYIYEIQKKYNDAIHNLRFALELSKKYNCHFNSGEIHMLLGVICRNTSRLDEALYHTKKAITFFDFSESDELLYSSHKNLGNFCILIGDYDTAIKHLEIALQFFIDKNVKKANTIKCDLLECLVRKGLFKDAVDYSEEINQEVLEKHDKGNLYKFIGKSYFEMRDLSIAKKYLIEAKEILASIDRFDYLSDTYNILAQLHSETKEYKEAYEYSIKANEFLEKSIIKGSTYDNN